MGVEPLTTSGLASYGALFVRRHTCLGAVRPVTSAPAGCRLPRPRRGNRRAEKCSGAPGESRMASPRCSSVPLSLRLQPPVQRPKQSCQADGFQPLVRRGERSEDKTATELADPLRRSVSRPVFSYVIYLARFLT